MEAVLWQCTAGSARAFYTPDRQVAKVDLPLTYFSKWEEFRILVLLTIFGIDCFFLALGDCSRLRYILYAIRYVRITIELYMYYEYNVCMNPN